MTIAGMASAEIRSHDEHLLPLQLRRDYLLTPDLELTERAGYV